MPSSFSLLKSSMISLACESVGCRSARRQESASDSRQGARDGHQLLLTAGQLVREQVLLADHLEPVEHVADEAVALRFLDIAVGQRNIEIFITVSESSRW